MARDLIETRKALLEAGDLRLRLQREILARKKAEQRFRAKVTEVAQLVASKPSDLIGISGEGQIIWWKGEAEEIFELRREDELGRALRACQAYPDITRVKRDSSGFIVFDADAIDVDAQIEGIQEAVNRYEARFAGRGEKTCM